MIDWFANNPVKTFLALLTYLLMLLTGLFMLDAEAQAKQLTFAPTTGTLSSHFGWRTDPMHGGRRFHSGIDIAANHGAPIYATQNAQVVYSGRYGGYGNVVVLDHGDSLYTLFGHASKLHVQRGDIVSQGQVIAEVGSSGRSTGPHLHFEVHHNRHYVNPIQYLSTLAAPGMVALSSTPTYHPANPQSAGGVEIIAPQKAPAKQYKHQIEVVRGQDVEVVRF